MLRALVAVLLLANLCFYAWTQGWLDGVIGARAIGDREPERLTLQVRPETVRILPPSADSADSTSNAPAPSPVACLEAGPFGSAEADNAQNVARAALPAGSWVPVSTEVPGVWIVYMGKYPSRDALSKKEDELKRRKLQYEELLDNPNLAPGLALGRYDDRASATRALEQFARQQDIHTARVAELAPASTSLMLRAEKADAALATQLASVTFNPSGKGFAACANAPSR